MIMSGILKYMCLENVCVELLMCTNLITLMVPKNLVPTQQDQRKRLSIKGIKLIAVFLNTNIGVFLIL